MHKSLNYAYIILIALTLTVSALASFPLSKAIVGTIIFISLSKFLIVGFQFMELKIGHRFWQLLLSLYALVIFAVVMILL